MRRWLVVLVTATTLVAASPAEAHTDVCSGSWLMSTESDVYTAGLGPVVSTEWVADYVAGQCGNGSQPNLSGSLTGHCERFDATGSMAGHRFAMAVVGNTAVFTGTVQGR